MSRRLVVGLVVGLAAAAVGVLVVVTAVVVTGGEDSPTPPVLLLPGYGGSTADLMTLADALEDDGRETVLVSFAAAGTDDLRDSADLVDAAARTAMDESGADSVDVVGFSAGGIVARLWVADDGAAVAHRVVTLASPNHGTDLVLGIDDCPVACLQLGADSDVMLELNADDETPDGPQWVTIWSDADEVIQPPESAHLDGAVDFTIQSVCPGLVVTHIETPHDPTVVAMVSAVLTGDEPAVPDDSVC